MVTLKKNNLVEKNKIFNNFMSIGRFFTAVDATYMYGVLRSGAFSGMNMDIDRLLVSQVQKDGNNELRKAYNQLTGAQSS